jgi:uncharacterized protein (TIGR03435 family)
MRSSLQLGCGVVCATILVGAQTIETQPPAPFEVASVKLNRDLGNTNMSINDAAGGQLNCTNVPLRMLLTFAYDMRDYQILNAPAWADSERYDIMAKLSAEDAAKEPPRHSAASDSRIRWRTQALLADRFGLKVHEEKREMSVYSLVIAKGGPKLQATNGESPFPQTSWNNTRLQCKRCTMDRLAKIVLASRMSRYVIDNTGLTGEFDFHMEFQPDEVAAKDGSPSTPSGPSFLMALEEQLGLKLVAAKGPVPFLIVDHVEKPSGN